MSAAADLGAALIEELVPEVIKLARAIARKIVGEDNAEKIEATAKDLASDFFASAFLVGVDRGIALAKLAERAGRISDALAAAEKAGRDRMDFPPDLIEHVDPDKP